MGCTLCPRGCNIERGERRGFCGVNDTLKVARAALHFWEEPCISGTEGSGAVFFSGCSLHCVYCQNGEISSGRAGKEITISRLCDIFLELQKKGANNINLVTPSHYAPQIKEALGLAKEKGLHLPVVYNCGGYESTETLRSLEGLIDIYLPDFKYTSRFISKKYSNAPDYFETAKSALCEMVRQIGGSSFDERGIMTRGVIVRHLVLPSHADDSKKVIAYLHKTYGDNIYISIMNQFTPNVGCEAFPELFCTVTDEEYDEVVNFAVRLGVKNGFIQEGGTANESFIPPFNCEGV